MAGISVFWLTSDYRPRVRQKQSYCELVTRPDNVMGGSGMTTSAADDTIFVLSDEIIDHINSFFPPSDNHHEKTTQACRVLQALINVIGMVLCEMDCPDCWELTIKAAESSFAQMLTDLPAVRAEAEAEQRSEYVH